MDKAQREQLLKLAQKDPAFKAKLVNILKTEKIATAQAAIDYITNNQE